MAKYTLIITEKPDAAARIAAALDVDGKPKRILDNGVPCYEVTRDKNLVIVPALGHLYTVASDAKGSGYPVFEFKWVPLYLAKRGAKRTRVWLQTIAKLAKNADAFIDACDYDVEGSIIGYCILKYACGGKEAEAKRMKYSTLTKEDVQESYATALPSLDFSLIEAGLARHEVDWLYGVNLSRALTQAAKKHSGRYTTLSTGRVQGPTLKFLAMREKTIRSYVPVPYWTITAVISIGNAIFEVPYEKKAVETKDETNAIVKACKRKIGTIVKIETKRLLVSPPTPFDLGSLQNEAYRLFKYTPMFTLKIAQRLYLDALISYPRTSSQKLPPTIGYEAILEKLAKNREHGKLARELLVEPKLKPMEGRSFDPAHPAIYPTGNLPERLLESAEKNIWNLVVRRFFAVLGDAAVEETVKATVDISGYNFLLEGKETLDEGWLHFYKPYARSKDAQLPRMVEGQDIDVEKIISHDEFTRSPPRYNPSSLLKRMQKENLGTKATRAGIIQTLYDRKYISEQRILTTDLGFEVINVIQKHCPTILSSTMTAGLEEEMSRIQERNDTRENVVNQTIETLKPVTERLKEKETVIGEQLNRVLRKAEQDERTIGVCPTCKTGKLIIIHSRKSGKRFVGCTNYFEGTCKTAFPLPQKGIVKPLGVNCKGCGSPTVRVWTRGNRSWKLCLNPDCKLKKGDRKSI